MDRIELTKIIGSPDEKVTTQVHTFDIEGDSLSVVISLTSKDANLTRMETIRGVVNFLHHSVKGLPFDFSLFKDEVQKSLSTPPFDAVILYLHENVSYVFSIGSTRVLLMRNGKVSPLLFPGKVLSSASGKLEQGDLLGLGTEAFWSVVPAKSLLEYVPKNNISNVETDFEVSVEQSSERGSVGGLLLLFGEPVKTEVMDEDVINPDAPDESTKEDTQGESEVVEETPQEEVAIELPDEPVLNTTEKQPRFFLRRQSLYEARGKSKKGTAIGAALLLVLAVSIFFGFRAKKSRDEAELVQKTIGTAQDNLSQARTLALVNKNRARELIYGARDAIASLAGKETKYPEVKGMKDEISESLGDVGGIYEDTPEVFSDLSLITGKMKADDISISEDNVSVLGKDDNRAISITLPGKKTETITGSGNFKNAQRISQYDTRTFVWEDDGIRGYGGTSTLVTPPISASSGLFGAFAGNLYVIDKSANSIWRYSGNGNGFGDKSSWLATGVTVDFSQANSMAIDGSIWVLSGSGKVVKFTLGNPQNVTLQGLDKPLSGSARLYTSDECTYLYVLDPQNSSLYVFEKTGAYVATYASPEMASATTFVVSETNHVMIIAAGSKLLSLPTKHIK